MSFGSGPYTISLGGGALLAAGRTTGTINVPGATTGMHVKVTPQSDTGAGSMYGGYVSSAGVVTVWLQVILAVTPPATVFNVTVES